MSKNKELLRLAIPNILSNISVPLLSTVDTALMGHLSAVHLGAVGVGSMLFNFIYWNFGFLRMGTTGMTAQAYGRGDRPGMILTLSRALLVAMVLALLLLIFKTPLDQAGIFLMNVEGGQAALVHRYFSIRILAAPASLGLFAMMGWFFGMQNAIYPMLLTFVINGVNMVVSIWLVRYEGMDVDGVAWGTVIAQYTGLLVALILWWYKYRNFVQELSRELMMEIEPFFNFLKINSDIFLRTLGLTFSFGFFYSQSSIAGAQILAVNVILLQFLNWMSYGVDGFAYAAESLVGKYEGAKNQSGLRHAIRLSFGWGMALALCYTLVYWIFQDPLLGLFTSDPDLIEAAKPFVWWMIIFPLLSTPCYIWDGIFIGLTASRAMRDSMAISLVFFLGSFYLLSPIWGNHGLWMSLLVLMVIRGIVQGWMYLKGWINR